MVLPLGNREDTMNFTIAALIALAPAAAPPPDAPPITYPDVAATCFKSGEQTSGMKKICYFNCLGSTVAITVDSSQLCPLSIND